LGEDQVLMPGFIDAHGHIGTALANSMLNMTPLHPPPISTVDSLDSLVSALVLAYRGSGPVVGVDYDDSFTGSHPTYTAMLVDGKRNALQAIVDETKQRDVIVIHNSGHMAVVSRNILASYYKILKPDGRVITDWSETESDLAGSFSLDLVEKDSQGFPTGLLLEGAWMGPGWLSCRSSQTSWETHRVVCLRSSDSSRNRYFAWASPACRMRRAT
jgi:predicted amidohydrolase YtcJ